MSEAPQHQPGDHAPPGVNLGVISGGKDPEGSFFVEISGDSLNESSFNIVPETEYELSLAALDDDTLTAQLTHLQIGDIFTEPQVALERAELLSEAETYSDILEDEIIATNPAVVALMEIIDTRRIRTEQTTKLMRVLRNTVAAQVLRKSYVLDDPIWRTIGNRIATR